MSCRGHDIPQIPLYRGRGIQLYLRQFDISQHRNQQVVEVVCNTSRQHAQTFQLLCVLHLRFQLPVLFLAVLQRRRSAMQGAQMPH